MRLSITLLARVLKVRSRRLCNALERMGVAPYITKLMTLLIFSLTEGDIGILI